MDFWRLEISAYLVWRKNALITHTHLFPDLQYIMDTVINHIIHYTTVHYSTLQYRKILYKPVLHNTMLFFKCPVMKSLELKIYLYVLQHLKCGVMVRSKRWYQLIFVLKLVKRVCVSWSNNEIGEFWIRAKRSGFLEYTWQAGKAFALF